MSPAEEDPGRPRLSISRFRKSGPRPYDFTLHSMKRNGEFLHDLRRVLSGIESEDGWNALDRAEWIAGPDPSDPLDGARRIPEGEPFSVMMRGTSEGYLVHLFVKPRYDHSAQLIATIKYLAGRGFACRVARVVNDALEEGQSCPDVVADSEPPEQDVPGDPGEGRDAPGLR